MAKTCAVLCRHDWLFGAGHDLLYGGDGIDRLVGGSGADLFIADFTCELVGVAVITATAVC